MSEAGLEALDTAVRFFRLGMDGAGNDAFVVFLDDVRHELENSSTEVAQHYMPLLNELLDAMRRTDTLWVADLLEAEFRPALLPGIEGEAG